MNPIRKLAGQTAIYGLSSIVGRVMNFFLTPLYTRVFSRAEYGAVTELYALVAFLVVLLTFGMETAFFRFASRAANLHDQNKVFSTGTLAICTTSIVFGILVYLNLDFISETLGYGEHPEYIAYFGWIVGLDALTAIPMARLRLHNKALPFAGINLLSISANIGLNLFFFLYCPKALADPGLPFHALISAHFDPAIGIGYIFIANLISSVLKFLFLLPWMGSIKFGFDLKLFKSLIRYALPLLFLGLAGIINETFDRLFFEPLSGLPPEEAAAQLGIYGACYKVAMLLSIGIQAYRFAAEPFVFSLKAGDKSDKTQADIMKWYFIVAIFITLSLLCFESLALTLIGEAFREGRGVIPILLLAYLCFGALFNLSFWYKLSDRTLYGMLIALSGAAITILINMVLVPRLGFYGSAYATLAAYLVMLVLSYYLGQKHHPIPYDKKSIVLLLAVAFGLFLIHRLLDLEGVAGYVSAALAVALYLLYVLKMEKLSLSKILK